MNMRCPNCGTRDIGKIGTHQYYCWGCFIELTVEGDKMSVHQIEEDGTLSSLDDLFFPETDLVEVTLQGDVALLQDVVTKNVAEVVEARDIEVKPSVVAVG